MTQPSHPPKITVITGDGKGKTTTALGLALQEVERGGKAFVVQFMKPADSSGEHFSAVSLNPNFTIVPMGRKGFIRNTEGRREDRDLARAALEESVKAVESGLYNIIVLDEISVALDKSLLDVSDVIALVDSISTETQIVITGRNVHPEVASRADRVLVMEKIKHPYDNGIFAREGIEY
jgi:cob(I)alamin adenosyltransferase